MNDLTNLFDKETVSNISELVQSKMKVLNKTLEFKEKDKHFSEILENFENSLSEDLKEQFDDVIKTHYQILDYYFTLAYFLGVKQGNQIAKF